MRIRNFKKVLITGGTGFLGKQLAKSLKAESEVILTGRNNKQNFKAKSVTGCEVMPMDVSNIESVRDCVAEVNPDLIIHAAATKFVDLSEVMPMECIDVNVLGSQNVARVAIDKGVKAVIGISTDKASPPIRNIYGMSKATMERIFCSLDAKTATDFACVRYGNVAWSTGSVLPIWKNMYENEGILRSTGPDMSRFFFTVDEAVQLILTAMENFKEIKGKVLSRSMKSSLIRNILEVWVNEIGGKWESMDGRPGDRLYECLIGELELEYTKNIIYNNVRHYLISFNSKVERPLETIISSDNAERLTDSEIKSILTNAPTED
jgi:UDP-N-acetylglucosamine 4,6-dehydratase/5-epimerase